MWVHLPNLGYVTLLLIVVRTIVELVKNKTEYMNKFAHLIGRFDEALRRACNNKQFCELYELAALASVLSCEIQVCILISIIELK
jgi:hypothetical protein